MTKSKQFKCFIAMAFDRQDTDLVYSRYIEPVLKKLNVIPIIINRQEDNRDINFQIIDQLNNCDFCIADLTYTRPSVYYEAGYAQKFLEVVYIVRADHLDKNQPEDRTVHFDLKMKPLIKWKNPDDINFPQKLEKRLVKTVLRNLSEKFEKDINQKKEQNEFISKSLNNRLEILRKNAIDIAVRNNFNLWLLSASKRDLEKYNINKDRIYKNPIPYIKHDVRFFGVKVDETTLKSIVIMSVNKVLVNFFRDDLPIIDFILTNSYKRNKFSIDQKQYNKISKIEENYLILSLNNTAPSKITSEMPNLTKDINSSTYFYSEQLDKDYKQFNKINEKLVYFYFPSNLSSISSINSSLEQIIKKI